jgi:hypothetical protein
VRSAARSDARRHGIDNQPSRYGSQNLRRIISCCAASGMTGRHALWEGLARGKGKRAQRERRSNSGAIGGTGLER